MKIRTQTPLSPDPGRLTYFVDPTKTPRQKDPGGISTKIGLTGDPVTLDEGTAPETDSDGVWLYSKDVSGISELFVLDGDGNEIQVTNNGSLMPAGSGGGTQFWPTQTGSSEFDSGETELTGQQSFPTGLVVAPTPGQASIIHFRVNLVYLINFDGDYGPTAASGALMRLVGHVAFNAGPGTPDVRLSARFFVNIGYPQQIDMPFVMHVDTLTDDGVTVLSTGELVLNFATVYNFWFTGRIVATSMALPADLVGVL